MTNPDNNPAPAQDPYATYLEQLVGYTVKQVIIYEGASRTDENTYGLIFSRTKESGGDQFLYTEILRDEEGNGPGHLHIEDDLS